jgi:hypothetical protein
MAIKGAIGCQSQETQAQNPANRMDQSFPGKEEQKERQYKK